MITLTQTDKRWKDIKLNQWSQTIGKIGCTTTCISMISDYFGCYASPKEIVEQGHIKYTDNTYKYGPGLILWQSINFDCFRFEYRRYTFGKVFINESLKDPKKAVILELDNGRHWVLALRSTPLGYIVLDPYDGRKKLNIRRITGSAHFISK